MAYLHPFVVYALVGVWVGSLLAWLGSRLLPTEAATVRAKLWTAPLLAPLVLYGLGFIRRLWVACLENAFPAGGSVSGVLGWLCRTSTAIGRLLAPVLAIALTLGLAKAIATVWLAHRLVSAAASQGPASPRLERILDGLLRASGGARPRVVVAPGGSGIFTAGLFRPVIVLPWRLLESLDDEELEGALAHELAHIRRGDFRWKWLLVLLRDVLLFTGLSGLSFGRLQAEIEREADAWAVRATGRPLALASAILKSGRIHGPSGFRPFGVPDILVPGLASGSVAGRVERLIAAASVPPTTMPSPGPAESTGLAWPAAGLWVVVVAVGLVVC